MDVRPSAAGGPLAGVTVVDLTRALAGPYATMVLGDLGARVVKVERPGGGDDARAWGPPFIGDGAGTESSYFLSINRNKESVTLDLRTGEGRAALLELAARAHILVENFRPGVLERLGLGPGALHARNPALVIVSITGFGHDGPQARRAGYDQIVQGEAGLMSLTGPEAGRPTKVGVPLTGILAGTFAAAGALAALRRAERTGSGDVVRTSLLAAAVAAHTFQGSRWLLAGQLPGPEGNLHPTLVPYGAFPTASGLLQVAVGNEKQWRRFARMTGLDPDDPRFSSNASRSAHRGELLAELRRVLAGATAAAWVRRLTAEGVPAGLIRGLDQVYESEQVRSQGLLLDVDHPGLGRLRLTGSPLRLDNGGRRDHLPPPRLGEHNQPVKAWLAAPAAPTAAPRPGEVIALLADPGSFAPLMPGGGSVVAGHARVGGRPAVLIVSDYATRAGTMGTAESERVSAALDSAAAGQLPVVAVSSSGGVRLQEGPAGLAAMAATTAAARRHAGSGGVLVTYWAHPSAGGVLGSWAGSGTLRYAQPGAVVALTGPRALGRSGGEAGWRSEALAAAGMVDEVCDLPGLRDRVTRLLRVLAARQDRAACDEAAPATGGEAPATGGGPGHAAPQGWQAVLASRRAGRPEAGTLLSGALTDEIWLHGSGGAPDDPGVRAAVGLLWGAPAVVVILAAGDGGTGVSTTGVSTTGISADGLRKARRAVALAGRLGLPLVSLVDTPGAAAGPAAESQGLALEVAGYLGDMAQLPVPSVGFLLGEGGGGVALAPLLADRVIATAASWLAPISPEAAARILHRDGSRAPGVADLQRLGAARLAGLGLVDEVVTDPAPRACRQALRSALAHARATPAHGRPQRRERRFRIWNAPGPDRVART